MRPAEPDRQRAPRSLGKVEVILNNSFGMLGINSAVIVKKFEGVRVEDPNDRNSNDERSSETRNPNSHSSFDTLDFFRHSEFDIRTVAKDIDV